MFQYAEFRKTVLKSNDEIKAREGDSGILIAVQGITLATFIEFKGWLETYDRLPNQDSNGKTII